MTTFYDYMKEHRDEVKAIIVADQQRIISSGKTFDETDIIPLQTGTTSHPELAWTIPTYDGATGLFKKYQTTTPDVYDDIQRSRPAPTAYVLPAGENWVADVLKIMERHGITYTTLPAGSTVKLRQYTGSRAEAALTDETAVSFPEGAYVFTMDTQKAMILATLLEPDMTDTARTLTSGNGNYTATSGDTHTYIAPVDGVFPIYRYEHDLNDKGMIDYTTKEAPCQLQSVSVRPSVAGIYYTGQFNMDAADRENLACYGVVLSLKENPKLGKDGCAWSELTEWSESGAGYGTVLTNIMTKDGGYSSNKANAEMVIYGVAYIKYKDGTVAYSDSASCTLRQLAETSDTMWDQLTDVQKDGLLDMYKGFSNVMSAWNIPNIKAQV